MDEEDPLPTPEMASFLTELEGGWPSLEDVEATPWACWPLWQPVAGGGTELNIRWPYAASMVAAVLEIAARTNVIVFDPQSGQLILPPGLTADTAISSAAEQRKAVRRAREGMNFVEQVKRELGIEG